MWDVPIELGERGRMKSRCGLVRGLLIVETPCRWLGSPRREPGATTFLVDEGSEGSPAPWYTRRMDDDEDVIRAYGDLQLALNPLPPGLDWDYFQSDPWKDDGAELGDSPLMEESPAVDAVYDWGNPLIVEGVPGIGCRVGALEEDVEICERQPEVPTATVAGGSRFAHLEHQLRLRGVRNPAGLAAWIGRRKYGARRFAQMAAAGRRAVR